MSPLYSILHMDKVNTAGSVTAGLFYAPRTLAEIGWLNDVDAVLVTLTTFMGFVSITFLAMYNVWRWFHRHEIRQREIQEQAAAHQEAQSKASFSQAKSMPERPEKPKDFEI